ncbi:PI-PLC domain-containing protein [Kluyvera cryocrescens]|uniref:hypothetical protein n=1 Tax=Kluyvera cryocrescens TaxID=580 RepID=UPI00155F219D|nr:hypothetical protein [Kluyvera cryocrescens]
MKIISHRGYWKTQEEKNTLTAFNRSFDLGFGTETDIRDYKGKLVISHDVPTDDVLTLAEFFECLNARPLTLALNIKADGLRDLLVREIEKYSVSDAFVFDMSVPDQKLYYEQNAFNVFTRMSEVERTPAFYNQSHGVWLDAFYDHWYDNADFVKIINDNKKVCIVSPELHKRDHRVFWESLKSNGIHRQDDLIICTDLPEEAVAFFKE